MLAQAITFGTGVQHACGVFVVIQTSPAWQQTLPQHPLLPAQQPPVLQPVLPGSTQVGQHLVLLEQPLLLVLPFGIVVRQKIAPSRLVLALIVAPVRSASTRQTLLRLALVKLAPLASARSRLESARLHRCS